ncbi:MAG: helix-turn-helix domain-containing protein [Ruminococcaceae bacterium]|nr:helix-turn-helix domain-containing protein [Oscillospiraceae bacterium]
MLKDRLKEHRERCGYSQQQVADVLNVHRSTYSYYESGKTEPSLENICVLARIFGVSLDALMEMNYGPSGALALGDPGYDDEFAYLREDGVNRMSDLTRDEKTLIMRFRLMTAKQRKELLDVMVVSGGEKEEPDNE